MSMSSGANPEMMGVFTGLRIKYPEFTVVTPQMGLTFTVRCLNVSEVSTLKSSSTTPAKTAELIDRVLFESIISRPDIIKNYDDFIKYTTLKDREALLYGLYINTFGDDREFKDSCDGCGAEKNLKLKVSTMFSSNPYPNSAAMIAAYKIDRIVDNVEVDDEMESISQNAVVQAVARVQPPVQQRPTVDAFAADNPEDIGIGLGKPSAKKKAPVREAILEEEPAPKPDPRMSTPIEMPVPVNTNTSKIGSDIISKEVSLKLPVSGVTCILRQPSIADELDLYGDMPYAKKEQIDLVGETLIIKRFEVYSDESTRPIQTISNRDDILRGYQVLPILDKSAIYDVYKNEFSQYGISLNANWVCTNCGTDNVMELDISRQFFRMVAIS